MLISVEYRFKHLLRTSLNSYPNPALYRCHICGKIVGFLSKLQSHMSLHYDRSNPVQMFACYICDEKFKYRQVRFFFFLFVFWAAAPKGTKSCRTQEESVHLSIRPSVPACPILRASSPSGPILTLILPNSPNPSNMTQI